MPMPASVIAAIPRLGAHDTGAYGNRSESVIRCRTKLRGASQLHARYEPKWVLDPIVATVRRSHPWQGGNAAKYDTRRSCESPRRQESPMAAYVLLIGSASALLVLLVWLAWTSPPYAP